MVEEVNMTEKQISMRLPESFLDRAEAIVPHLSKDPNAMLFRVSRAYVLRHALRLGLQAMENEYGIAVELEEETTNG